MVGAGEPLALVERAQHGVARAFVLAGAVTLLLALIASYLAGARVTAPLRRMAAVAHARRRRRARAADGSADRAAATRCTVLAEAFNHMLDRLAEAFAGQREFVADASHELRTPLTVIRGQLEVLAAQEDPSEEEVRRVERLVQAEITRISRLVDDLLLLAQAEQTDFLRPEPIDVRPFVDELWDGLSLTAERRFELGHRARRARSTPIPTGSRRRCATSRATRSSTPAHETGLVRLEVERRRARTRSGSR